MVFLLPPASCFALVMTCFHSETWVSLSALAQVELCIPDSAADATLSRQERSDSPVSLLSGTYLGWVRYGLA